MTVVLGSTYVIGPCNQDASGLFVWDVNGRTVELRSYAGLSGESTKPITKFVDIDVLALDYKLLRLNTHPDARKYEVKR